MNKNIVVTGGAGYIGSHVSVELLRAGCNILIIDDFSNSHPEAVRRIGELAPEGRVELLECDLADAASAEGVVNAVQDFKADGAVHLAGLKAVGESVAEPARYYRVNIGSALTLIRALEEADAKLLVFSSSATVYGELNENPVKENGNTGATNPYGRTKLFIEEILKDMARSDDSWKITNLRYFNPVGADPSGRIGEDPHGVPNNLFPFIAQVAVGRREKLAVFGDDYDTPDGTGVRDYIHVSDLARGHVAAVKHLDDLQKGGAFDVNLGTGNGSSVLEAIGAFQRASNREIKYDIVARRDGDVAEIYADADLARDLYGWSAERNLDDMCTDHWRWQNGNPNGYKP
ncbi:MAG: UDP-glucose 4-epimerase GalE [Pseudomonadota bacterium]